MWLGSSVAVLWLRLVAVALTGPLAWEPPCAAGVALKSKKKKGQLSLDFSLPILVDWSTVSAFQMAGSGRQCTGTAHLSQPGPGPSYVAPRCHGGRDLLQGCMAQGEPGPEKPASPLPQHPPPRLSLRQGPWARLGGPSGGCQLRTLMKSHRRARGTWGGRVSGRMAESTAPLCNARLRARPPGDRPSLCLCKGP